MAEKPALFETVVFDDPTVANALFGPHNAHLDALAQASGVQLHSRGASVYIAAPDKDALCRMRGLLVQLYDIVRADKNISQQDVLSAYAMLKTEPGLDIASVYKDAVFVATARRTVTARNLAQRAYLEALRAAAIVFAVGPAGTGKTYLAVATGLAYLMQNKVRRIVLTRPAVEAGERLGFLPGDVAEKVNPYLRPLYDALHDMLPQPKVASMLETGVIEIAPLAFMRGRTLADAFVILDEAQNTTPEQMKMFLTRMGFGTRMVITGDITQIDLPPLWGQARSGVRSGLIDALTVLNTINGILFHHFSANDVVRHPLVSAIVNAYDHHQNTTA